MTGQLTIKKVECILPAHLRVLGLSVPSHSRSLQGAKIVCSWGRTPTLKITVMARDLFVPEEPLPATGIKVTATWRQIRGIKRSVFHFTGEDITNVMNKVAASQKSIEAVPAAESALNDLLSRLVSYIKQLDQ